MTRDFMTLLKARWAESKFVCVGLDPELAKIPHSVRRLHGVDPRWRQFTFNRSIVDATKDIVCAYKLNVAFYRGAAGKRILRKTIQHIRRVAPHVVVILDGKTGDIGNSSMGYVEEAFDYYDADACTVHFQMGMEAMRPYLDQKNKGIIVLCKTSNPGSGEFQNLEVNITQRMLDEVDGEVVCQYDNRDRNIRTTMPLYQWVAKRVASRHGWNYNGNCCLVVGATYPEELALIRQTAPDIPILCPGPGKQGADVKAAVHAARDSRGNGFIMNSSSGIIFASPEKDFANAARLAAKGLDEQVSHALFALT